MSTAPLTVHIAAINDALVLTHARALLTSSPEGATVYVDSDARDTDRILTAAVPTIDLDQPVAVHAAGDPQLHRGRRRGARHR